MKETIKTSRTAGYLEKIFRALNNDWFGGELEEPIITIQSTPRAYGHVTVSKIWKSRGDERRHELNIGAETLERPIENVVATMMHEAVHLYNLAHGVQDCSRGNTYHNKHFRDEAERRGLVIEHHPTYGWTITEPSEELIDYIIKQGWTEIRMNRGGGYTPPASTGGKAGSSGAGDTDTPATPKRSSTRKYVCPCCGNSVRATKAVNLICGDCMEKNGGGGLMAAKNKAYQMSFRCYFGGSADNLTKHRQELPLKDIPKWIEAYQFTHPTCRSISVKVWFDAEPETEN